MLKQNYIELFIIAISFAASYNIAIAQTSEKSSVQNLINSNNFVFKAQTALPLSGGARQLTPDYNLRLLGDSIVAYLPYFGRAYVAGFNGGGGVNFTSTQYDYKIYKRKKGGWNIDVKPKDTKDVRELYFTISEDGYATLQVTSENRQAISYNGYITGIKK